MNLPLHTPKSLFKVGLASISILLASISLPSSSALAQIAPAVGPPPVGLSTHAIEAASAFRAYVRKAGAISPAFSSGLGVEESLAVGSAYEPQQLSRGAIAYAALLALQDPTFVAGVRVYAVDPGQRSSLAARLVQNPSYAGAFPGAANAAGLIEATLGEESGRIQLVGGAVKKSAYSVQHSAWSKSKIINPSARLNRTKTLSAALMSSIPDDVEQLKVAVNGGSDARAAQVLAVHGQPATAPYPPVVAHGLALAALAALGEAGDDNDPAVQTVLADPTEGACLNMSKLNLYQCLAVAGPWYEDIFCLGEHALGETAQCIAKGSGPSETAPAAQAQTQNRSAAMTAATAGPSALVTTALVQSR